jgi:TRAP-type C4-dicarboxylate transport system permease small subunit
VVDVLGLLLVVTFILIVVITGLPYIASTHSVQTPVLGIPGSVTAAAPVIGCLVILPFVIEVFVQRMRGGEIKGFDIEDPTTIPGGEVF